MIAQYNNPDHGNLKASYNNTYWTAARLGDANLLVILVTAIESGVIIAPNEQIKMACPEKSGINMWFHVE